MIKGRAILAIIMHAQTSLLHVKLISHKMDSSLLKGFLDFTESIHENAREQIDIRKIKECIFTHKFTGFYRKHSRKCLGTD